MARRWIAETEVWLFRPRVERLAGIPALVVTGSFHPAVDAVGAALAAQLDAELVVFPEGRHNVTLLPDRLNPAAGTAMDHRDTGSRPPLTEDRPGLC